MDYTLFTENEDKLMWQPGKLKAKQVEKYLSNWQGNGVYICDDEQALYQLHKCDYNIEEALEVQPVNVTVDDLWSDKDRKAFELGLKLYGKDFHLIQTKKVPTKTVAEIIQFYYCQKFKSKTLKSPEAKRLQQLNKRFTKSPESKRLQRLNKRFTKN